MAAVMTIMEANVLAEDSADLQTLWREAAKDKPAQMAQSWLIHGLDGGDAWAAVAIWPSPEAFEEYRASGGTRAAMKLFHSVNAQPMLAAFNIVAEA